jgi:hypothetical protein
MVEPSSMSNAGRHQPPMVQRLTACAARLPHSASSVSLDRESVEWGMQDPSNDPHLRAADEFLVLSKNGDDAFHARVL